MPGAGEGGSDLADRDAADELPVLKALLHISEAVSRANYFDEVLEVVAEQARSALGAASLTITRWEPDRAALRTLINVGNLAPHQQRWPVDDFYEVTPHSNVNTLLRRGIAYTNALDDENCPAESVVALQKLGMEAELAVPVMVGDSMWGLIWATGDNGRRFDHGDKQLIQAIAAHAAMAIGRSELLTTVWRYAFQDPLTGIANRRAVDQFLADIDWESCSSVVALLCDLDGFKRINDRDGHPAGDRLLRDVARQLERMSAAIVGSIAARLGGDEFCVVLRDATLASAQIFAIDATKAIRAAAVTEVSVSWGAAAAGQGIHSGSDLLAAADAALMEAKRQGPARYSTIVATSAVPGGIDRRDREAGTPIGVERLAAVVVGILDSRPDLTVPEALEILAMQVQQVCGTAAWVISECTEDHNALQRIRGVDCVRQEESGLSLMTDLGPEYYDLTEYPATVRALTEGTSFVAAIGLEDSDPAETALLAKLGYQAVVGIGVPAGRKCFLLEFYSHDGHQVLAEIAPLVTVLATYCVSRLTETRPPHRPA
ncbi:diguanylate cyclase domain-containing protein [Mycolicibacterium iranicum]|uniref:Diguanylate cyclase n=1 Tax=Mycolicibacterium iranicum TaxID=912594 RepID=A0A178M2P5_MYCIR|nr:diguanylate cyclase [Mycolicibacterium iranicum]OAN41726.1 diguanylate cyclase [Mycolicibacterium iranicum]